MKQKAQAVQTSAKIKKLVQNYFEINGTFTGIEFSCFIHELRELAKLNELDLMEYCYALLGFSKTTNGYKAKFDQAVEKAAASCQAESEKLTTFRRLNKKFGEEIDALSEYYRSGIDKTVMLNDGVMPFPDFIQIARAMHRQANVKEQFGAGYKNKDLVKALLQDTRLSNVLVKEYRQASVCAVCNDVLLSPKILTDADFNSIHKVALTRLVKGSLNYPEHFIMSADTFATLSFTNVKLYCEILAWAAAMGMTYAAILKDLGFNVADLSALYKKDDICFMLVGSCVLLFHSQIGTDHYEIMTLDTFRMRYAFGFLTENGQDEALSLITGFN